VFPADFSEMAQENASAKDEVIARPRIRGVDLLRDPLLNKVIITYALIFLVISHNNFYKRDSSKHDDIDGQNDMPICGHSFSILTYESN
jgi:hypothetical protein